LFLQNVFAKNVDCGYILVRYEPEATTLTEPHTSMELAAESLREAILSGSLLPGDRLHQGKLAEMLGISRTPLRAALTTLAQTGLVSYESNRGFAVREFFFEEVAGAFAVRAELEAMACRLAANHMTDETNNKLARLVAQGDSLLASGSLLPDNLGEYRTMNVEFHTTVMQLSGNPWITTFIQSLHNVPAASDRVIMWRDFDVIRRSHDDHHRIAHALSLRQGERAAALMREHITFALEHLQQQLKLYPQDFLRVPSFKKPSKGRSSGQNKRTSS
jgi:GntR family transcriptional regulator of vanillate catabolism